MRGSSGRRWWANFSRRILVPDVVQQRLNVCPTPNADQGVRVIPEVRLPVIGSQLPGKFFAHVPGRYGLQVLDQVRQSDGGFGLKKNMHMVGFAAKLHHLAIPLAKQVGHDLLKSFEHVRIKAFMPILH